MGMQQREKTCSLCPGQLDCLPWAVSPPLWDLTALGVVRPPQETGPAPNFSKTARTTLNTFKMLPGAQIMQNFSPLLTMHESRKNAKSFDIELLKYTKFIRRCYTCPNEQVRYSIAL
jgi:hypothetical protein